MTKQQTDSETVQENKLENSLGDLLHRTRQSRKKTIEDAAESTRINAKFLRALEANDFGKLPDEIFTRGFIKLYATYLGLDPDDTFKHYISQEEIAPSKPEVKQQRDAVIGSELMDKTSVFIKKRSKIMPVTIMLSILVIFYLLGVFFKSAEQSSIKLQPEPETTLSQVDSAPQPDSEPPLNLKKDPVPEKITEQTHEPAKPAVRKPPVKSPSQAKQKLEPEKVVAAEPVAQAAGNLEQLPPATAIVQPDQPVEAMTLPITVKVATATTPPPEQLDGGTDVDFTYVLEARFEESSLVRVKVDDKPQLQYNSQAGIVRVWKANESIVLELDNKAGVSLTLNGQPFAITDTDDLTAIINIPADLPNSNNP